MHSVTSRAVQSVHLAAGPLIQSFTASSERSSVSWTAALITEPTVKANAKNLNLKAKVKTDDLITEAKARPMDLSIKAKAKDMPMMPYCPRGASKPKTWPRGLQH